MAIGSSFEEARGSVQEANSAYGPTESEIRNLQNEIQRLSGEIAQKETQVHEQEQELENNEVQIEHLQSEIDRLETEIEELEEEQSSSDDEDDDSGGVDNSAEIASLQSLIDQLSTEVNHLQTQSQQMRQVISQMQAEIQRLQQEKLQKEQDLQVVCSKCMAVVNFLSGLNGVLLTDAAKNQSQAAAFSNIASTKYGRSAAGAASQVGNYAHQRTQLAQEASRLSAAYATLAGSGAYITASAVNGFPDSSPYSPEERKQLVVSSGRSWASGLSMLQRNAIYDYSGTAYMNINASLRGTEHFTNANQSRAIHIHQALSNASMPCTCTVYRGASVAALGQYRNASDQELIGMVIRDAGFMSTSLNADDAFSSDIQLEIEVPAGAHGAYIGHISSIPDEREVLFDAGTMMEITGVRYDNDGSRIITTRML